MLKKYLEFINENKSTLDLKQLEKDVWEFRKHEEQYQGWEEDKTAFKNTCTMYADELTNFLSEKGYNAVAVCGYYTNVQDEYEPDHWDWKVNQSIIDKFQRTGKMPNLTHCWVEVDGKFIVDITADQFHPGNEDEYRVVVVPKKGASYKKSRR